MFTSIRFRWNQFRAWCRRTWSDIRPGPEARKGAVWAILAAALWAALVGGDYLQSGFGPWIDYPFALVVAALCVVLIALVVALLLTIFRKLPRMAAGAMTGGCVFVALVFMPIGPALGPVVAVLEGFLGAAIATILFGNFRQAALSKKIITGLLLLVALAGNVWLYIFLSGDGEMGELLRFQQTASPPPDPLAAPNPADPGSYP